MTQVLIDHIMERGLGYQYKGTDKWKLREEYVFIPIHFGLKTPDTTVDDSKPVEGRQNNRTCYYHIQSTKKLEPEEEDEKTKIMGDIEKIFEILGGNKGIGDKIEFESEEIRKVLKINKGSDRMIITHFGLEGSRKIKYIDLIGKSDTWHKHVESLTQDEEEGRCNEYWCEPYKKVGGVTTFTPDKMKELLDLRKSEWFTKIRQIREHVSGLRVYLKCKAKEDNGQVLRGGGLDQEHGVRNKECQEKGVDRTHDTSETAGKLKQRECLNKSKRKKKKLRHQIKDVDGP